MDKQIINSDISYTDKDFNSIYSELLDLTKKLTNKWDPSISNESDPGVVLLKLNALIADKNNYNIDKNILECFPLSVTQQSNARKLYDLLGYKMNYYISAQTKVSFMLKNADKLIDGQFIIPQFTSLKDSTGEIVYTTLQDVTLTKAAVNTPVQVDVIEGRIQTYSINGNDVIGINNLDEDLRLYFTEKQIAQNGIFIKNSKDDTFYNLDAWTQVDNLSSKSAGSKVYEFGLLPNSDTCYIQFPIDISNLIGSGIEIKYLISNGLAGNIKANTLTSFVDDITAGSGDKAIIINDLIKISQPNASNSGRDPESLSDAYKNYKRTVNTFDTLVTRKDYENYLYNLPDPGNISKPFVSNVVIADRTCDLNQSNYIQTKVNISRDMKDLIVRPTIEGNTALTAYDIVPYLLYRPNIIQDDATYDQSFTPDLSAVVEFRDTDLFESVKSVQHDIMLPEDEFIYTILYRLNGTIITYYKVTTDEKKEIEDNVKSALYNAFNSRNVEFGSSIDYDELVSVIENSDSRIKTLVLDIPKIVPEVINIKNEKTNLYLQTDNALNNKLLARMILAGNVQLFDFDTSFAYDFGQSKGSVVTADGESKIDSISSEVIINLSTANYAIRPNESIQILEPSLITSTEYSTYVNYTLILLSAEKKIKENTAYKLAQGESLKLTYTDSNNVLQTVQLGYGDIIESNIELTGDGAQRILRSGQYIRQKTINKSVLDAGTNYYFITNLIDNDQMKLNIPAHSNYVLSDNEYFIYTNSNATELVILSSGTLLHNPTDLDINWVVNKIDIKKLTENGIDSIKWNQIPDSQKLELTELSITNLENGVNIKASTDIPNINNDLKTLDTNITISYTSDKDLTTAKYTDITASDIGNVYIQSRLHINANQFTPQVLQPGQSITLNMINKKSEPITPAVGETVSVLFNAAVVANGGEKLSVQVLSDDVEHLEAYRYKETTISTDTSIKRDDDGVITLTGLKANTAKQLNFTFNPVKSDDKVYLIPIEADIAGVEGQSIVVKAGNQLCSIYGNTETSITTSGTYILAVPKSDAELSNLNITASKDFNSNNYIKLSSIFKLNGLNTNEIDSKDADHVYSIQDNIDKVIEEMKKIDTNNKFDWTYIVPDDDKVIKPIQASSYWDINHIYNKYAIPKIDFANYSITVHSSSINRGV